MPRFFRPPHSQVLISAAFLALIAASATFLFLAYETRSEIVDHLSPARNLVVAVLRDATECSVGATAHRTPARGAGAWDYADCQKRLAAKLSEMESLLKVSGGNSSIRYEELVSAVDDWRRYIEQSQSSDNPNSPDAAFTVMSLLDLNSRAVDLHVAVSNEIDVLRSRIDRYEILNIMIVILIAAFGLIIARRAVSSSQALAAALRVRNEVLRVVSHDLRNPLASIQLSSSLIAKESLNERQQRFCAIIQRSGRTMDTLIEDLLSAARLEHGAALKIEPHLLELRQLLTRISDTWRDIAEQKDVRLAVWCPSPLMVYADERRVAQALSNLVANAIKFTPPGGSVTLSARVSDNAVEISVADTGVGISDSEKAHLFTPFWHKPKAGAGGTGLGLSIAKQIVEDHGGCIWFEPNSSGGSIFRLTLPRAPGALAGRTAKLAG